MRRSDNLLNRIDWLTILLYFGIVILGWLNIYASVYDSEANQNIFNFSTGSGRQLVWFGLGFLLIIIILAFDFKFFESFAYIFYGLIILTLILTLVTGREVAGSKSWIYFGSLGIQPSEFAKVATVLVVAKILKESSVKITNPKTLFTLAILIGTPIILIILQGDMGTALIFLSFLIVLYREGIPSLIPLLGLLVAAIFILTLVVAQLYLIIGVLLISLIIVFLVKRTLKRIALIAIGAISILVSIKSVDFFFNEVLKPHQQNRIRAVINPEADPLGYGWNVTQSKIAIGSGGLWGKGFLNGTQTKFDFVPKQSTDFIFSTIGEEHGWVGSLILIVLFITLFLRVITIAERQKWRFARVYGYGVAAILFTHFGINIGMTIGLFPVIGVPLPFFSYGGSALWSFTILLFILIKLDAHRMQLLLR